MMKHFVAAILMLWGTALLAFSKPVERIDPKAVDVWLAANPSAQVLDVRTKQEFASGHLPGAVLVPWTDADFKKRVRKELDSGKPTLLYCRSGGRSASAAAAMEKLGFETLREIDGGILAWKKAGKAVRKPK